ncbi:MAG: DUF2125 domain-containing protein [Pseudomonadota bacterium]
MAKWALILVVAASVLWGGWWVVGARATEAAALEAIAEAEARGWDVARDDLSVRGFPNRFDLTLTEPRITAPAGWTLSAPILGAFALAYRPNHVIAVGPDRMDLATATFGDVAITSDDLRASLIVSASTDPLLDRATIVTDGLSFAAEAGAVTLARGQIATRRANGPTVHDVAIDLSDLSIPGLRDVVQTVDADATVTFDRPLGAGDPPRLDTLDLRATTFSWGEVGGTLSGRMSVTSDGTPRGDFTLRLIGWERLLDLAVQAGLIPAGRAPLVAAGLRGLGGEDGAATVPIVLADGRLQLLGFPIASLPRLPVPGG